MAMLALVVVSMAAPMFAHNPSHRGAQKSLKSSHPHAPHHSKSNLHAHHSKSSAAEALKTAYSNLYLGHEMDFLGFCAYNGPRYKLGFKSMWIHGINAERSLMQSTGDMCLAHWKGTNTLYHGTPKGNWPGGSIRNYSFHGLDKFYPTDHVSSVAYFGDKGPDNFAEYYRNSTFTSQFLDHPKVRKYKIAGSTAGTPDILYFDLTGSSSFNLNWQSMENSFSLFNREGSYYCKEMNSSFAHFRTNFPTWKGNQIYLAGWIKYFKDRFNFDIRGVMQMRKFDSKFFNNEAAAYCWRHHGKDNGFSKNYDFAKNLTHDDGCLKAYMDSDQDVLNDEKLSSIEAIIHPGVTFPNDKSEFNVMYEEICLKDTPTTFLGDDNITNTETSMINNLAAWGKSVSNTTNYWTDPPYSLDYRTWIPSNAYKDGQYKLAFWKAVNDAGDLNWGTIRAEVTSLIDGMDGELSDKPNEEVIIRTRILPAFKTIVLRSSTNFLTKDELDKLRVYAHLLLQEFCKNKFHQLCARKWVDRQNDVVYHDRDVINDNTHLIEGVPGVNGVKITRCYKDSSGWNWFYPVCLPVEACEKRANVDFRTPNDQYCKPRTARAP